MLKDEPFRLTVNGDQYEFQGLPAEAGALDLVSEGEGLYHLLRADGQSLHFELLEADYAARRFTFRVDGAQYTVGISDFYERLVQELGLGVGGSHKQNAVKAPMPGLVLSILVAPGQVVQKGDALLILEAMKMENVLKAAADGTVKSVAVKQGAAVEKGQLLVEM